MEPLKIKTETVSKRITDNLMLCARGALPTERNKIRGIEVGDALMRLLKAEGRETLLGLPILKNTRLEPDQWRTLSDGKSNWSGRINL